MSIRIAYSAFSGPFWMDKNGVIPEKNDPQKSRNVDLGVYNLSEYVETVRVQTQQIPLETPTNDFLDEITQSLILQCFKFQQVWK